MRDKSTEQKIRQHHLERVAVIYDRSATIAEPRQEQSTNGDVVSRFRERALLLGWSNESIKVRQDIGRSGMSINDREGMKSLLADIQAGSVGAVFVLDETRITRCGSDWHDFLKLCRRADVLIVTEETILNLNEPSSRLICGILN